LRFGRHGVALQLADEDSATWTDLSGVRSDGEERSM
jgi:hypothetical protein